MRIIGGKYRGKTIMPPQGYKARPTTDFAKEGLFNVLNNEYRVMDGVMKADIYCANMVILTRTGDAYVYGLNTEGGIGDAAVTNGTPKKILSGVADVAAGYGFTAYLMDDGTIRIQGDNSFGQAGNGQSGGAVNMAVISAVDAGR